MSLVTAERVFENVADMLECIEELLGSTGSHEIALAIAKKMNWDSKTTGAQIAEENLFEIAAKLGF